jgi:hypothetical protein
MKEETSHRVRTGNAGALDTVGSFVPTNRKSRIMVLYLGQFMPYQGATQDERP